MPYAYCAYGANKHTCIDQLTLNERYCQNHVRPLHFPKTFFFHLMLGQPISSGKLYIFQFRHNTLLKPRLGHVS